MHYTHWCEGAPLPSWIVPPSLQSSLLIYAVGVFIVATIPYFLLGGAYFALDVLQPAWSERRRLSPRPKWDGSGSYHRNNYKSLTSLSRSDRSTAAILRCLLHAVMAQLCLVRDCLSPRLISLSPTACLNSHRHTDITVSTSGYHTSA